MKRRLILALVAILMAATGVLGAPSASARPTLPNCGVINIGYTILQSGYIKGSGGYTSCASRPFRSVNLYIQSYDQSGWNEAVGDSYRHPFNGGYGGDPVSLTWSARPFACRSANYRQWRTVIRATYFDGATLEKISNTINVQCGY
jgi:hypothetical protein